jgi:hypothetical protein
MIASVFMEVRERFTKVALWFGFGIGGIGALFSALSGFWVGVLIYVATGVVLGLGLRLLARAVFWALEPALMEGPRE